AVAVTRAARPAAIAAILLEHAATAAADPHPTVAGTPVEAFAAIGAAQLLDQTHLATAIQRAFLAAVVDGLAGDLTVCIGHAAALEHAAAAVADPDAVTARAPAAAFPTVGAAQLLDQTNLSTTIQRAFLPPVVDGLAGDLTVGIGHA